MTQVYATRRERRDAERQAAVVAAPAQVRLTVPAEVAVTTAELRLPSPVAEEIPARYLEEWAAAATKPKRRHRPDAAPRTLSRSAAAVAVLAGASALGGTVAFAATDLAPAIAPADIEAASLLDAVAPAEVDTAPVVSGSTTVAHVEVAPAAPLPASLSTVAEAAVVWPVGESAPVTSNFGGRESPTAGASTNHGGTDFAPSSGTPVGSMSHGVVTAVDHGSTSYGVYVDVTHTIAGETVVTRYAHLTEGSVVVAVGDSVDAGETLGNVGNTGVSTGPHLHFEVHVAGVPVDPIPYLNGER